MFFDIRFSSLPSFVSFRDILDRTFHKFDGKFDFKCQESAIPASVNRFGTAVTRGTASKSNENPHFKQASLTVSQLLAYNPYPKPIIITIPLEKTRATTAYIFSTNGLYQNSKLKYY